MTRFGQLVGVMARSERSASPSKHRKVGFSAFTSAGSRLAYKERGRRFKPVKRPLPERSWCLTISDL